MTSNSTDFPREIDRVLRVDLDRAALTVDLQITAGVRLTSATLTRNQVRDLRSTLQAALLELDTIAKLREDRKSAAEHFVATCGGAEKAREILGEFLAVPQTNGAAQ